jgi:hypothetical protein
MVELGHECLGLLTQVTFCVWCFEIETWGMITMFSLRPDDNRTGYLSKAYPQHPSLVVVRVYTTWLNRDAT